MTVVAAFYRFVRIDNLDDVRANLEMLCQKWQILGTALLAHEGINGTLAGSRESIDALKAFFALQGLFLGMEYKESQATNQPFQRLKVRIKKEIVTFKNEHADPLKAVGTYVSPKDWNQLIQDEDVTVIDVRNDFEVAMGSFDKAIDPKTKNFSDFAGFVKENLNPSIHKKIAMACTGGIRCEKASSYMMALGFAEVYHLKGGILQYLQDVPKDESLWQGHCFVFDERRAVDHDLKPINSDA